MRRRLTLTLILLVCALAAAASAYAATYATQTSNGASTSSRSASGSCSVRTHYTALRLSCRGTRGAATATYAFQLPSNVVGTPAVLPVPLTGAYTTSVKVVGSTAYATITVRTGTYTLKWVNLAYYVK